MVRTRSMAALIAAGMVATVAAAPAQARDPRGENRSLYSINQPVVQRTDFVLDLSAASGNLSVLERGRLRAWFASLDLGYGDRIFVDEPYGPGGGTADVARVAGEFGLLVSDGVPVTVGPVDPRSVRVIVSRSTASVPGCPNWRGASVNTTSANYGCATNSNLAAMIADPSDLVLGQAGSLSVDSNAATKAIKVYRETPPSGSKGLTQTSAGGH